MERDSSLGYLALKKEATKGTAVTPNVYAPLYSESLTTDANFVRDNAVVGSKFKNFQTVMGLRAHGGDIEVLGEPNIAGYLFDAFMTKGTTTGGGPYTHPFTFSKTSAPNSYTIDISYVTHVVRFVGCEISGVEPGFENGEMRLKATVGARKCFGGRYISATADAGGGDYTVTLKTDYDASPTDGLVAGDTMQIWDASEGTYINFTITSVDSGTQITTTTDITAGDEDDVLTIKPATPSLSTKEPFLWGNSEFRVAADAATALTATHTPLEEDSGWSLMHPFEDEAGAHRSGSFDPASYPRLQGDAGFKYKRYFDTPEDLAKFASLTKIAIVARHFVYSADGSTYELRVTLNHLKHANPQPAIQPEQIAYSDEDLMPQDDSSDGQGADVKVLNAVSSI